MRLLVTNKNNSFFARAAFLLLLITFGAPVLASEENVQDSDKQDHQKSIESSNTTSYHGFYLTASAGGGWVLDQTGSTPVTSFAGVGYSIDTNQSLNGGFALEAGIGYDFGKLRTEIAYARNNQTINSSQATLVQRTISAPLSTSNIQSYANTNSVFASIFYDFSTKTKFTPYVGGGLGVTQINWGGIAASGYAYNLYNSPGNATALGYQAKVGVSYELNKALDLFLEGNYQGSSSFRIGSFSSGSPNQSGFNYNPLNLFGAKLGIRIKL